MRRPTKSAGRVRTRSGCPIYIMDPLERNKNGLTSFKIQITNLGEGRPVNLVKHQLFKYLFNTSLSQPVFFIF